MKGRDRHDTATFLISADGSALLSDLPIGTLFRVPRPAEPIEYSLGGDPIRYITTGSTTYKLVGPVGDRYHVDAPASGQGQVLNDQRVWPINVEEALWLGARVRFTDGALSGTGYVSGLVDGGQWAILEDTTGDTVYFYRHQITLLETKRESA